MKIKVIKKNKRHCWWYDHHVGEKFEVVEFRQNDKFYDNKFYDNVLVYDKNLRLCQINLEDTNYYQIVRKEKLKKINEFNR